MALPKIFDTSTNQTLVKRINAINSDSQRLWGKMSAARCLNTVTIPYDDIIDDKHRTPRMRLLGKLFSNPS
jgi:hypothetical protein